MNELWFLGSNPNFTASFEFKTAIVRITHTQIMNNEIWCQQPFIEGLIKYAGLHKTLSFVSLNRQQKLSRDRILQNFCVVPAPLAYILLERKLHVKNTSHSVGHLLQFKFLPESAVKLKFQTEYVGSFDNTPFPTRLEKLMFCCKTSRILRSKRLPLGLKELLIYSHLSVATSPSDFNPKIILPPKLEVLFCHVDAIDLDAAPFPSSLLELTLNFDKSKVKLSSLKLPSSLEYLNLVCFSAQPDDIEFLRKLSNLCIENNREISGLENQTTTVSFLKPPGSNNNHKAPNKPVL